MAHAVRGFSLLLAYSGGFSAICHISHFNASVRRFNVWRYPYTAAAPLALWPLFMDLWRGVAPCSVNCRLRGALPACRRSRSPVALPVAVHCSGALGGLMSPVATSPCVAFRQSRRKSLRESRESRWQSRCESRKRLRQSRSFYPKIIVVYKIPCINAGFFLPTFP